MKKLMGFEIEQYGGKPELADRFLKYGETPYVWWLVRKYCLSNEDKSTSEALDIFSTLVNIPYDKAKYLYYRSDVPSIYSLKQRVEFKFVLDTLLKIFNNKDFWYDILPYCYKHAIKIVIEEELKKGRRVDEVAYDCGVKNSLVYLVRKDLKKGGEL